MNTQPKPAFTPVTNKFESLREVARNATSESLAPVMSNKYGEAVLTSEVSLQGFNVNSQKELRRWENTGVRRVAWDWETVQYKYRTHPKRFELTIWHRDLTLCGASIGRPTFSGGKLRLDYLESSPLGTKLDGLITDITIATYAVYARAIGAIQLRIMNPVNMDVRDHYLSKPGFSYNRNGDYCFRNLT